MQHVRAGHPATALLVLTARPRERASGSEPVGGDTGERASGSEPVGGDPGERASGSEPVGGDTGERAMIADALRPADDASYEEQVARPAMSDEDAALAAEMIGRPLRGHSAVAVRCRWGLPAVLRVAPRLQDGTPFPTLFWLSCPLANRGVGRLEASGVMADLTARLGEDPELAVQYRAAHHRYVAARDALGPPVPGAPSAGGMPGRVKCLHALYGHHLATRDNPVGAWVAEQIEPMPCPAPCVGPRAPASRPGRGDRGARGE